MAQTGSPDHIHPGSNESKDSYALFRSSWVRLNIRFRILQVLSVVAAILIIVLVVRKPAPLATIPREGDLASVLVPILAAAIGINLFIEMAFSVFEQSDKMMIAFLGRGLRWLKQAETEVSRARQWQMDVFELYSHQLQELDRIVGRVKGTKDPKKVVELATARVQAARDLLDLAEARANNAETYLDRLVDHSSYQRFKWSVVTYFSILLGLLVAIVTSMQIFTIMGIQLSNPKVDMVLTGLFIGGLVYPVHQVIANIWDILTKLVKK